MDEIYEILSGFNLIPSRKSLQSIPSLEKTTVHLTDSSDHTKSHGHCHHTNTARHFQQMLNDEIGNDQSEISLLLAN